MDRVLKEKTLIPRLTENFKDHAHIATNRQKGWSMLDPTLENFKLI